MKKGNYVDGFVLVIPKKKVAAYKKLAKEGARTWKRFGALEYKECMGQDLTPKTYCPSSLLGFIKMTKSRKNETVWFSYIVFKDKRHRDAVNKKVMEYYGKKYADAKDMSMPFEEGKAAYGGFTVVVS